MEFRWRGFRIALCTNGRWSIWYGADECLAGGVYKSAQHALDDLSGGHTDWPSTGDPSLLPMPDEIGDWTQTRS